jgi:hypothetical protein
MITDNVSLRPDHKAIQLTGMTYSMGMAMPNGRQKSIQHTPVTKAKTATKRTSRGKMRSEK